MSRVGSSAITIPADVTLSNDGGVIVVKGKNGELSTSLHSDVELSVADNVATLKPARDTRQAKALWGTMRSNLNNMVVGVTEGFTRKLEINGVGFKAAVSGSKVTMNLGYSHQINYELPDQVKVTVDKDTSVTIEGPDKQKVGMVAAELRGFYPVEPYKAKGVKYAGEQVRRKEGKTVQ